MKKKFLLSLGFLYFLANPIESAVHMPIDQKFQLHLPLYYYDPKTFDNLGDILSLKLVEKMIGDPVEIYRKKIHGNQKKILAIGSILTFASDNDIVWGSGVNGKYLEIKHYRFKKLDVRALRGPLTRQYLKNNFQIDCPEIYGDPALLMPYVFPDLKRKENPKYDYLIIPHYSDEKELSKSKYPNVAYTSENWLSVVEKILDSKFVISSSLHGIIIAEAFGVPARLLRISEKEHLFKYQDYYSGTGRPNFEYATSVDQALEMQGEKPFQCDLQKLYDAFPFEYASNYQRLNFENFSQMKDSVQLKNKGNVPVFK